MRGLRGPTSIGPYFVDSVEIVPIFADRRMRSIFRARRRQTLEGSRIDRISADDGSTGGRIMKVRPLHDRVVIKRLKEEEKTRGGIIIPDTAKEKPVEAKVIAVGSGKVLEDGSVRALEVKAGDTVLLAKYAGSELKLEGEDHVILREDDILAVIEG
jgi:chaperonin GroES